MAADSEARVKVAEAARRGEVPSQVFKAEDLAFFFRGREAELEELESIAWNVQITNNARRQEADERREVAREPDRVLREWDSVEQAERRRKAETEARKRLGLEVV
jgi:hypothetical protein